MRPAIAEIVDLVVLITFNKFLSRSIAYRKMLAKRKARFRNRDNIYRNPNFRCIVQHNFCFLSGIALHSRLVSLWNLKLIWFVSNWCRYHIFKIKLNVCRSTFFPHYFSPALFFPAHIPTFWLACFLFGRNIKKR